MINSHFNRKPVYENVINKTPGYEMTAGKSETTGININGRD